MCGSLTMAAGFSIPAHRSFLFSAIMMSMGRVFGYALIGILANSLTQTIVAATNGAVLVLSFLSAILLFGVGLHIANFSNLILKTEIIGQFLQPVLQPLKQKLTPIDSNIKCLGYGLAWGFIPCGLVYSALSLALVAPDVTMAGSIMLFFGLGTVPVLVGLTSFSTQINRIFQQLAIRRTLGIVVILMALYHLTIAFKKLALFL